MKNFSLLLSAIVALVCGMQVPAYSAEPWEIAAIKGVTAMNQGDGKTFEENAHTEFKGLMQSFMIKRMRADPTSSETKKNLKDYGVSNVDEIERIPLEEFVRTTIGLMYVTIPPAMKAAIKEAQFEVVKSELEKDVYGVTIEMTFSLNGRSGGATLLILSKREGETWKYYGDSNSMARYFK